MLTFAGFLGKWWWVSDLFAHFRMQYFCLLFLSTMGALFLRRYLIAIIFSFGIVLNAQFLIPRYFSPALAESSKFPFRVMQANVHWRNFNHKRLLDLIRDKQPDIIVLEEVTNTWLPDIAALKQDYPYQVCDIDYPASMLLLSKYPLINSKSIKIGGEGFPSIITVIRRGNHQLTIVGTHPTIPSSGSNARQRDAQLTAIVRFLSSRPGEKLLVGDLNTTAFSGKFPQFLTEGALRESSQGFGWKATWPTWCPIIGIPIDHCLYSAGLEVCGYEVGPNIGSDHYPLLVDFAFTK